MESVNGGAANVVVGLGRTAVPFRSLVEILRDKEEFGYTPVFCAKSAQAAENKEDAIRSLARERKSEGRAGKGFVKTQAIQMVIKRKGLRERQNGSLSKQRR